MNPSAHADAPATNTRLFLAIDNCFASKRWCEPAEWMRVIRYLGIYCVEASADNEIDPLYSCRAFLDDWIARCPPPVRDHRRPRGQLLLRPRHVLDPGPGPP